MGNFCRITFVFAKEKGNPVEIRRDDRRVGRVESVGRNPIGSQFGFAFSLNHEAKAFSLTSPAARARVWRAASTSFAMNL